MQDLVEKITHLLEKHKMTLVTAESCTGGLLATTITHKAGASKIFDRGFITYSDISKIEMLGVSKNIIEQYGSVSQECAQAMALGALKNSKAQVSIAITGIAGPDGGTETKPVGYVCFGYAIKNSTADSFEKTFPGNRAEIQAQTTIAALKCLISALDL
jgi:nicotinamide-nucleotide amidase